MQGIEHAGQAIEPVVARDPGNELKHPDDAHDHRQLHVQVEPAEESVVESEQWGNALDKAWSHCSWCTQPFLDEETKEANILPQHF